MSGGGSGSSSDYERTRGCDNLSEETVINSPNPSVVATLSIGDVLDIRSVIRGDTRVVEVVTKGGDVVGSITGILRNTLVQCISEGYAYEADVLSIVGGGVTVLVRNR